VRIVAQHASVAVPRSRPHLCGGVVTLLLRNGIRPITLHVILHIATLTTTVVLGVLTMPGLA
jgi:hypothetical protein